MLTTHLACVPDDLDWFLVFLEHRDLFLTISLRRFGRHGAVIAVADSVEEFCNSSLKPPDILDNPLHLEGLVRMFSIEIELDAPGEIAG